MSASSRTSIPLHREPKFRSLIFQALVLLFFVWGLASIADNTARNMATRGIIIGLDWLDKIAPFALGFSPFIAHKLGETTYWDIFFIAVQNTVFVSFFGIIGATVLGFVVGVMRLSPNWLVAKIASVYVEFFRNVPLLLWFFFWYVAVFLPFLPGLRDSIAFGEAFYINNEGLYFPRPVVENMAGFYTFILFIITAIMAAFFISRWARRRQEATGMQFPAAWVVLGLLLLVPLAGYFLSGSPFHWEYPELGRFQLSGGINVSTSFLVCWFALTTYTAAFIAENVRGGILAVSHGQTEAANSLGLRRAPTLRLVIIPQAMRVIIPPTISQFLNLTKHSTLAVAVAYEEIASLWMGISLNTTGQALVIIAMSIGVFWMLSLLTSALLNWYNRRVQLAER